MSINDITGDKIQSKPVDNAYSDGYDSIVWSRTTPFAEVTSKGVTEESIKNIEAFYREGYEDALKS